MSLFDNEPLAFAGRLLAIAVTERAKGPMGHVPSVEAVEALGLRGDRYGEGRGAAQFKGRRSSEKEVTLIAREAIEAASLQCDEPIEHLMTRRNLLVEGVPLNDLVGKTFRVGEVLLKGMELCEPCGYLEKRTFPGIQKALKHRGGLRTMIVRGGVLTAGDEITPAPP
jgi:MOSC domain-containing protein YiiM